MERSKAGMYPLSDKASYYATLHPGYGSQSGLALSGDARSRGLLTNHFRGLSVLSAAEITLHHVALHWRAKTDLPVVPICRNPPLLISTPNQRHI
jgi:hypothetical protein